MVYFGEEGDFHRKLLLVALRRRSLEEEEGSLYSAPRKGDFDPFAINSLIDEDPVDRPLNSVF